MATQGDLILLRGFVERRGDWWQAVCIDLDIAAQGKSLEEAKALMDEMVRTYLESLSEYAPADRRRFLNRKSPLSVRLGFFWRFLCGALFASRHSRDAIGFISHIPCPA